MISSKYIINSKVINNIIKIIDKNTAKKKIFYTLLRFKNMQKDK